MVRLRLIALFVQLTSQQIRAVEPEPKFPALAPPSKNVWLRLHLQSTKIAFWAPAPQPW